MQKSVKFYREGLRFQSKETEDCPKVIFFSNFGTKLELYPLDLLTQDISETNPPEIKQGFSGITLAYNVKSEQEVHETLELACQAGASVAKEPQKTFWGGYHAYFADPDGYYWEVAYNPFVPFDENDMLIL